MLVNMCTFMTFRVLKTYFARKTYYLCLQCIPKQNSNKYFF